MGEVNVKFVNVSNQKEGSVRVKRNGDKYTISMHTVDFRKLPELLKKFSALLEEEEKRLPPREDVVEDKKEEKGSRGHLPFSMRSKKKDNDS